MAPAKFWKVFHWMWKIVFFFVTQNSLFWQKNTLGRCFNVFVQLACWDMKVHVEMSPTTSPGADGQVVELLWGSFWGRRWPETTKWPWPHKYAKIHSLKTKTKGFWIYGNTVIWTTSRPWWFSVKTDTKLNFYPQKVGNQFEKDVKNLT